MSDVLSDSSPISARKPIEFRPLPQRFDSDIEVPDIDLHMHSTASDGTDDPGSLARLVKDAGLAGFALTDHDTTAGLAAAAKAAKRLRIGFVPGIELSADPGSVAPPEAGGDAAGKSPSVGTLHILGYHVRHDDEGLAALDALIDLGFCRVLTSGQASSAPAGTETIAKLVRHAAGRIEVLPGGGVRPSNAAKLMADTGCTQLHGSLRTMLQDTSAQHKPDLRFGVEVLPPESQYGTTDGAKVAAVVEAMQILTNDQV